MNNNYLEQPSWTIWYEFTDNYCAKHNLTPLASEKGPNPIIENPIQGLAWSKIDRVQRENK